MFTKAQFVDELKNALPDVLTTKVEAEKTFDAFCAILAKGIESDEGVRLPGVGSFSLKQRPAREGRNPQTGKAIKIPAKRAVKFATAKGLDEALNK
ncbi:histone family protein DNA-binding protein [Desulfovibrio sp. X2]|uniref:HU family DNA-binding protein n=1 Tax=Desulfovibrio sp. X2 TaxID=941449 RepID=UPI000358D544|nr:HU family DNA-binding protein [Desulfovibrio sp. X2]EPR43648.1 histone family protein DNA-binding protein [Desulfovibrio sp. X2]